MKKLTASNDPESSKPKQGLDMRSINVEEANKKMGAGGRFTKIGGGAGVGMAGRGFKKVGVSVGTEKEKKKEGEKKDVLGGKGEEKQVGGDEKVDVISRREEEVVEEKKEEDTVMAGADDEEEEVTWEQYDFTKPTGCDHASCAGCKTDGIWSGEWVTV